jgi:predicted aspartyl protease
MRMSDAVRERFEQEKQAYWQQRDDLLKRFAGKWVAVVGGQVVATGDSSGAVIRAAYEQTGNAVGYVARVGHEDEVLRVRQVTTGSYDQGYSPPIPKVDTRVQHLSGSPGEVVEFVVDTGADLTLVQEAVADQLGLWDSPWRTANVAGIGGVAVMRQLFAATVSLDGHDVAVAVDCRDDIDEDILGRDVINEFELIVCAKRDQVEFRWIDAVP